MRKFFFCFINHFNLSRNYKIEHRWNLSFE